MSKKSLISFILPLWATWNGLFTEEGIRAAIEGNLTAIEAGLRPATVRRPAWKPYKKHPKYTGLLALYVHSLYVLGKAGRQQYPARGVPQLRQEVMKAERYRAQFAFLRKMRSAPRRRWRPFNSALRKRWPISPSSALSSMSERKAKKAV